ncbi:hypothetical protein XENTR_v10011523 [Xenopus tropicalis]|uniref:MARVEL domain-containing protein 3 isoform X2 n=2 Tax=Xenopus tropicalis TaxID=8364 RepID=A0A8J0SKE5_XENTR|nr:MARVEL domain-containing protein 3 isoform X2 [Xenopus tropicalis]KAE8608514.1 hypothetical protein XENTR_v10011523 [Xenopus tropicalis]
MARSCVSVRRRRAFRCVYGIKRARSGLTMGDSATDRENRAPRKHRHHQENDLSSERNIHKPHNKHMQENDQYSKQYHNERTPSRNKQERSRNSYPERDQMCEEKKSQTWSEQREKYYREKEASRNQQERSQGRYDDKDGYYKERGQDRSQKDMSQKQYLEKENYHKETEKGRRNTEKSQNDYHERDEYRENYSYNKDRHQYPMDSKEQERYYADQRTFSVHGSNMEYVEEHETDGGILDCHKCRYLCTSRALCQLLEVLFNMLILICCSVSYNSTGGYTGITDLGGIYYYAYGGAYSGFSGADGQKAQQLDVQFYQLKLPTVRASMGFGGALMAFCCLLVLLGVLRVPWHFPIVLLVECVLDILIAVGYLPALYFYFKYLQDAYNSQVCKDRESLYSSKGYQGFTCSLHAADIAAVLFACMAVIAFFLSAALAIKGYRRVRQLKKKPNNYV